MKDKKLSKVTRLQILRDAHQMLDDEADRLNAMKNLSENERNSLRDIKVRRLRLRDAMEALSKFDESK